MTRASADGRPPAWRRYLRFWGPDVAADVDDELRFHLEMRAAELEARGVGADEAHRAALARFGSVERARGECETIGRRRVRARRRVELWGELRQDATLAARGLRARPGWAASVVLTLGLGIAATATVFSIVNAFLFRPLPVQDGDRLVAVQTTEIGDDLPGNNAYTTHRELAALRGVFDGALAWQSQLVSVRDEGAARAERRSMALVSDHYFTLLGLRPALGRLFTPAEAAAGEPLVVLSHAAWRRDYAGDSAVLGRTLHVNGVAMRVVGVGPDGFTGTQTIVLDDGWLPATSYPALTGRAPEALERRSATMWRVLARLAPGTTIEEARAALDVLAARLSREHPDTQRNIRFLAAMEARSRPDMSVAHLMPRLAAVFMALVALVLLVACANVAGLLLARSAARQGELALRSALGAGRGRLVRQLLTETLVLAALGGVVGIALAVAGTRALSGIRLSTDMPVTLDVTADWRVAAFAALAALAAALGAGLLPALRSTRLSLADMLKDGGRAGTGGRRRQRARSLLVTAQVAVTALLLVCAALLVRGVQHAMRLDLGFRTTGVAMASADVSLARHDRDAGVRYFTRLADEASRLPGVRAVALARTTPLGYDHMSTTLYADLPALQEQEGRLSLLYNAVTPGFFALLDMPLREGRDFTVHDDSTAARVAVVNATLARRLWPDGGAVGRQFRLARDGPLVTVIGVVTDAKEVFVHEAPRPMLFFPFAQSYAPDMTILARTEGSADALLQPLRAAAAAVDAEVAPYDVKTMHAHLHQGIAFLFSRLGAALATAFGALALVQALAGLYGLLAYTVSLRTREIGVRMALGARGGDVLRAVMLDGARMTLVGLAAGLLLAVASTRLLGAVLNGVSATDPLAYGAATAALLLTTAIAALLPARRAARVAPGEALRGE